MSRLNLGWWCESVSVPNLKISNELGLSVINSLLVKGRFILKLFQLVESISILPLVLLKLFQSNQLLLVNNILNWLVVTVEESILANARRQLVLHVLVSFFKGHLVQCFFKLIDFGLDRIALLCL